MFAHIDLEKSAENGATLEITHPASGDALFDEDGKAISIRLLGVNSATGKRAIAKMVLADEKKGKQAKPKTVDQIMDKLDKGIDGRAELYAALTLGWSGISYLPKEERGNPKAKPEALPFSAANAKMLYSEYTWVAEQVKSFMEDEANFISAPGTN